MDLLKARITRIGSPDATPMVCSLVRDGQPLTTLELEFDSSWGFSVAPDIQMHAFNVGGSGFKLENTDSNEIYYIVNNEDGTEDRTVSVPIGQTVTDEVQPGQVVIVSQ